MNKKIIGLMFCCVPILSLAKDIQINALIDTKAINCSAVFQSPESKIAPLLQDFSRNDQKNIKLNKTKQTMTIGQNTYHGVRGYQYYKTKHMEQEDLAVNFALLGTKVIKIALQSFKSEEGESGMYYLIFEGKPVTVTYHLRKAMGSDWNIENTLEETPQGNSKLVCVYAG